jgi:hypothetical protein
MALPPSIADICAGRDAALAALGTAVTSLGDEIAQTVTTGPYLDQLTRRYQDLMDERAAIRTAATDAVLALPAVQAAAATLIALSAQMTATAGTLPTATSVLTTAGTVLTIGQQFADLIGAAQKA